MPDSSGAHAAAAAVAALSPPAQAVSAPPKARETSNLSQQKSVAVVLTFSCLWGNETFGCVTFCGCV